MRISTNLSTYKAPEFESVQPGVYTAEIVDVQPQRASTGTSMLNVEFEIVGPSEKGRHVWAGVFLTDKARWKLAALLNAVNVGLVDELDTAELVGRRLRIRVKEVDGEGQLRTEAVAFRKLPDSTITPF